ncbi:hypothetical protein EIK77_006618 [Talaromyces pinophilus]|nr:hypothetical protein EIK77_006618 [Talaromyces pinophilus]
MRKLLDTKRPVSIGEQDFLDRYLEAQQKYPQRIDDYQMISYLLTNTVAGSHPTAYTLTAMVYYVLKTEGVLAKICAELESATLYGTDGPVSYKNAKNLPYLEAVIRESIRVHPGFALVLEREVPEEGFHLPDGKVVAPGTIVGMDPWVINRNEEIFGPETDSFKPERWLQYRHESVDQFNARRQKMFNTILSFGSGARACLGQSLGLVELYKTAASLFANFDVRSLFVLFAIIGIISFSGLRIDLLFRFNSWIPSKKSVSPVLGSCVQKMYIYTCAAPVAQPRSPLVLYDEAEILSYISITNRFR